MYGNRRVQEMGLPSSRRATAPPRVRRATANCSRLSVVAPPPRGKSEREEGGAGAGARSANRVEGNGRRASGRDRKGGTGRRGSGQVVMDERRRPGRGQEEPRNEGEGEEANRLIWASLAHAELLEDSRNPNWSYCFPISLVSYSAPWSILRDITSFLPSSIFSSLIRCCIYHLF